MSAKQSLLKSLWDYHAPPAVQTTPLPLWTLVVNAWRLSRGHRLVFLAANYMVVCFALAPAFAPVFAEKFPSLVYVPQVPNIPPVFINLLTLAAPWLYYLFIYVPLKLGLFLLAARIVYRQPYRIVTALPQYLRFFWLVNLLAAIVLVGFFLGVPLLFMSTKLFLAVEHNPLAYGIALASFALLLFVLAGYIAVWCLLLFIGRVNLFHGYKTAIQAANRYFWPLMSVLLIELIIALLSKISLHTTDLLTVPFSYLLWLCLYQHMFGAKACRM